MVKNKLWTKKENTHLTLLHTFYPNQWSKISKMIKTRSPNAVRHKYRKNIKKKNQIICVDFDISHPLFCECGCNSRINKLLQKDDCFSID